MDANELTTLIIDFANKLKEYQWKEQQLKEEAIAREISEYNRIISYFSGPLNEGFEKINAMIVQNGVRPFLERIVRTSLFESGYFDWTVNGVLINLDTNRKIESIEEFIEILREAAK